MSATAFSPTDDMKIAIIAGNGKLPVVVAETLINQGNTPFMINLRGEVEPRLYEIDNIEISIVELSKLIRGLKQHNITHVVLAGGVKSRPVFKDLRLDGPTLKAVPLLLPALKRGDDALLRAFILLIESYGFKVIGAHQIVPQILAPIQMDLTQRRAKSQQLHDIDLAVQAALKLGSLDVGQGAVAVGGRVVALEGAEGTDAMLERVSEMRQQRKIPQKGGVLVKMAKPQQDSRADLPTIGIQTIENAHKAALDGIAIEAERSIILDMTAVADLADHYNMFIETFISSDHEKGDAANGTH